MKFGPFKQKKAFIDFRFNKNIEPDRKMNHSLVFRPGSGSFELTLILW